MKTFLDTDSYSYTDSAKLNSKQLMIDYTQNLQLHRTAFSKQLLKIALCRHFLVVSQLIQRSLFDHGQSCFR